MYYGLDDNILSMSTILVLISVLRLYKRMFLETELFRGKKTYNVSNLLSNGSKTMFLHLHTYIEKKRMTQQIRQYANEWWFWVMGVPCTILFLNQKLGGPTQYHIHSKQWFSQQNITHHIKLLLLNRKKILAIIILCYSEIFMFQILG